MGILQDTVKVRLTNKNIKYLEELGYFIPRYKNKRNKNVVKNGTCINIKTKDLLNGSHYEVNVECDCCKKQYNLKYYLYIKQNINGKIYCNKCNKNIFNSGENNNKWNPNLTEEERINRNTKRRHIKNYTEFIKKVLIRDNYTCQCCGQYKDNIEVHHLDGYDWCKDKRTDETNGITLCKNCHKNFHSIYGYGNNTKEQYEEWIGKTIDKLEKYDGELPTARRIINLTNNEIYKNYKDCMNKLNIKSPGTIYDCCNHKFPTLKNNILMWEDEYLLLTKEEIIFILTKNNKVRKKVKCINTGVIFNSIKDASTYYNTSYTNITACCSKKTSYAGILKNGEKLKWEYVSFKDELLMLLINKQ